MKQTYIAIACLTACTPLWAAPQSIELSEFELTRLGTPDLPPVVVNANRQIENKYVAPPSATLITSEDIERSGYTSVAEIIQKLAFVNTRPGLLSRRDATFDLRGFGGSDAYNNVAIIVDGVRYSEKELASARISSIPIHNVASIEVVRGGASVSYGDGASGGVIRITTLKPKANTPVSGQAVISAGSFGTLDTSVTLRGGSEGFGFVVDATESSTDGYRQRSGEDFGSAAATLSWTADHVYTGVRFGTESSDARLPGSLSLQEFIQDPRQGIPRVNNFGDFSLFKRDFVTAFFRTQGLSRDYGLDISQRDQRRSFQDGGPTGQREVLQDQVSGFVSDSLNIAGLNHTLTIGLTSERAELDSKSQFSFGRFAATGNQSSYAFYASDDIAVSETLRVNAGYRLERFYQYRFDTGPFPPTEQSKHKSFNLEAYELGFAKTISPVFTAFSKYNKGYRVPNIDENDPTTRPPETTFLNPQLSEEVELGVRRRIGTQEQVVRLFKIWLDDEIANVSFSNVNLDKTQRIGVELEHRAELTNRLLIRAAYTYTDSEFRTGALKDTRVPLVPAHRGLVSLTQTLSEKLQTELLLQAQSDQRLGGDLLGAQENGRAPGYAVADLNLRYGLEKVKFIFSINNLFDRDYFSQAFYNQFPPPGREPVGVYPDPGRNIRLTAQFDF